MSGFRFLIAIVRRDYSEDYVDFFKRHGVAALFGTLCEGATKKRTLDLLGLKPKEKVLLCCVVPSSSAGTLMRRLVTEMRIDAPDTGIAVTVSVDGIGGASGLRYLCGEQVIRDCEAVLMNKYPYSLIVAIPEKGHAELVMDAAREAGARGGTIVRAKEVDADLSSKFFGVTIAEEKEMIYIVARSNQRDGILRAIMDKAGIRSEAHTIAFSLPVDAVAGLPGMEDETEESR